MRLEKKRILKEDGRYLVFYHSAATASADQQEVFAQVASEPVTLTAPKVGVASVSLKSGTAGGESKHV